MPLDNLMILRINYIRWFLHFSFYIVYDTVGDKKKVYFLICCISLSLFLF